MATKTSKATRDKGKSTAAPSDTKAQSTTASPVTATPSATPPMTHKPDGSAIDALKQDHRRVEQLFAEFEEEADGDRKDGLVQEICRELIIHTKLEEEIFYPACREGLSEKEMLDEAQVEHDSAKFLIGDLLEASSGDRFRNAKVSVLTEQIKHHVAEEENPGDGIFVRAQASGLDTAEVAQRLRERKKICRGALQI
jgi:hemerythrin superfamily protein